MLLPAYLFEYDLEKGEVVRHTHGNYSVKYYNSQRGVMVEIGDGYRHELHLEPRHWNRLVRLIREDELDASGIEAITHGLMKDCLYDGKYAASLIKGIKEGKIKEIGEKQQESGS